MLVSPCQSRRRGGDRAWIQLSVRLLPKRSVASFGHCSPTSGLPVAGCRQRLTGLLSCRSRTSAGRHSDTVAAAGGRDVGARGSADRSAHVDEELPPSSNARRRWSPPSASCTSKHRCTEHHRLLQRVDQLRQLNRCCPAHAGLQRAAGTGRGWLEPGGAVGSVLRREHRGSSGSGAARVAPAGRKYTAMSSPARVCGSGPIEAEARRAGAATSKVVWSAL